MNKSVELKNRLKESSELKLFGLLILLVALMSILSPSRFLNANNIKNIAYQLPEFCLLSLAMMVVIITGGINLSICAIAAIAQITIAKVMIALIGAGMNHALAISIAIVAALIAGVICGYLNGLLISHLNVNPMLATLGTSMFFEGIALRITNGSSISGFPEEYQVFGAGDFLGIPIPVYILIFAVVVVWILLSKTMWGDNAYFCGCNIRATAYSGVNTNDTLIKAYVLSGVLSVFAALIMTSRYNSAKVDYGASYLMQALTAVLLGGTDINGGYGKVAGTVIGVLIIQIISNGLNIFGANRYFVNIVTGAILILVLAIKFFSKKVADKKMLKSK